MSMLYHITTEDNAEKILCEGLKPMIGPNSKLVGEKDKAIYLCNKKDIPYWQIILGCSVVLQVSGITQDENNVYKYGLYDEYQHRKPINKNNIKEVNMPKPSMVHMRSLCLSYLASFSRFTELCARYYDNPNFDKLDYLNMSANSLIAVMNNLDYSVLEKSEIKKELKEAGENGAYTLCDHYCGTDNRLYSQLICYPEDILSEKRTKIYNYIKKNLSGCLDIETGGWCG